MYFHPPHLLHSAEMCCETKVITPSFIAAEIQDFLRQGRIRIELNGTVNEQIDENWLAAQNLSQCFQKLINKWINPGAQGFGHCTQNCDSTH